MCISPNTIQVERGPSWVDETVACGSCWQCRNNRVSDYVGRSLCEAQTSERSIALTLTYAPRTDLAEKVITPRHFQRFVRALRKRGHLVRYIVAAEHGELKGRVHFHAVLFVRPNLNLPQSARPTLDWPHQKNFHIEEWPHGHVYADLDADDKALRYICKYLLKYEGTESWISLSKKPPLGHGFFYEKALYAAKLGVLPSTFHYLPPNGSRTRPYYMTGATRREYLLEITRSGRFSRKEILARTNEFVAKAFTNAWKFDDIKNALALQKAEYEADNSLNKQDFAQKTFDQTAESILSEAAHSLREYAASWEKRFDKRHKKRLPQK